MTVGAKKMAADLADPALSASRTIRWNSTTSLESS
jgi:hypothetical protein